MKLICSPISPYARKVMIYIAGDNPLGKIPALEWQPGQFLFDSPVICEYLDSLRDTPLLPAEGHARLEDGGTKTRRLAWLSG